MASDQFPPKRISLSAINRGVRGRRECERRGENGSAGKSVNKRLLLFTEEMKMRRRKGGRGRKEMSGQTNFSRMAAAAERL